MSANLAPLHRKNNDVGVAILLHEESQVRVLKVIYCYGHFTQQPTVNQVDCYQAIEMDLLSFDEIEKEKRISG